MEVARRDQCLGVMARKTGHLGARLRDQDPPVCGLGQPWGKQVSRNSSEPVQG